jgi:hypothetical protein
MDFIFVGFPGQQKWIFFWRFHDLPKFSVLIHRTVLKYWYDRTASLTMIMYISGSFVRTAVSQCQELHSHFYLCFCTCMPFSCTALSLDASLRTTENDVIWGAIVTGRCRDSSAVDSRQWSRDDRKTENAFLLKTKTLRWQDHTFSIWLMWFAEFLCFTKAMDGRNKNDRQEIWVSELFL